jgi:uroporphyrinogen III methyltransferase/synthase
MAKSFCVGARDSVLSLLQARSALQHITEQTGATFELIPFSSPGDRDQTTDLRFSAGDFFTRDLDQALLNGTIDFAIHSAKDLSPEGCPQGMDWFWLPWKEDPRDCIVARTSSPKRIGVSSERRIAWVKANIPEAECLPLRGTIPARLEKLDKGAYDAIIVAVAALHRLGLKHRITRTLSLEELPTPPGQGALAITFRRGDERIQNLRNLWLKAVRFIGAGVGAAELCTLAGQRELQQADVVIYDALMDATLLNFAPQAQHVYVGKRSGCHAMKQAEITSLIEMHVRRGERVVRLKGGDPGLFGRLAEETSPLVRDGIPFRVWPGVSALTAATTPTGCLLTMRGESCGFCVETPRSTGTEKNDVYFMALGLADELAKRYAPTTPCAIIYDAGAPTQQIDRKTVADLHHLSTARPGLLVVGPAAQRAFPFAGPLGGKKIWVTGSPSVAAKAHRTITDLGGEAILSPLIYFTATQRIKIRPVKAIIFWCVLRQRRRSSFSPK